MGQYERLTDTRSPIASTPLALCLGTGRAGTTQSEPDCQERDDQPSLWRTAAPAARYAAGAMSIVSGVNQPGKPMSAGVTT